MKLTRDDMHRPLMQKIDRFYGTDADRHAHMSNKVASLEKYASKKEASVRPDEILASSFLFSDTPQGHQFWRSLAKSLPHDPQASDEEWKAAADEWRLSRV